jgi:hypothetical protein
MNLFAQPLCFVLLSKKDTVTNVCIFFVALVPDLLSESQGYFYCHVVILHMKKTGQLGVVFIHKNFSLNIVQAGSLIHTDEGEHRFYADVIFALLPKRTNVG